MSLPKLIRFSDLKELGFAPSWCTLQRWIEREGFPPGRLLGANTRVWTEEEVAEWLVNRPSVSPTLAKDGKTKDTKGLYP